MAGDFVEVGGEGLHFLELEGADDGWPCATLIDELGNVAHTCPPECAGVVEYPTARKSRRFVWCSAYCNEVAGLVRYRRRVERDRRHERPADGPSVITALWRRESDLINGAFYKPHLTNAQREEVFVQKGRVCSMCGKHATDIDHIVPGAGDAPSNLQPLCQACHLLKTAVDGGRGPVSAAIAKASKQELEPLLSPVVLQRARTSGISMLATPISQQAVRYASYLIRVYADPPRTCDDEQNWKAIELSIRRQRRDEMS